LRGAGYLGDARLVSPRPSPEPVDVRTADLRDRYLGGFTYAY